MSEQYKISFELKIILPQSQLNEWFNDKNIILVLRFKFQLMGTNERSLENNPENENI